MRQIGNTLLELLVVVVILGVAAAVVLGGSLLLYPLIGTEFLPPSDEGQVRVTRRRVRLVLNVEIYDQREDKALWQRSSMSVDGEYTPPLEAAGRRIALEKLVADIVDGAQSQW